MITALESLPTTIAHLRTIATPVVDHRIMPFGIPALDDRLASRGLRAGALHEVAGQSCSMVDDAAATLFLAGIAAREAAHTGGPVLWVQKEGEVIHVICDRIIDHGDLLHRVGEMSFPHRTGRGDGAKHSGTPDRGDKGWSPNPRNCYWPPHADGMDPEAVVKFKSHDFH